MSPGCVPKVTPPQSAAAGEPSRADQSSSNFEYIFIDPERVATSTWGGGGEGEELGGGGARGASGGLLGGWAGQGELGLGLGFSTL